MRVTTIQARPGNPCYRNTGGKVRGVENGDYLVRLKNPHRTRRGKRGEA